ncbi:hypothetical protein B0H34DRAFT_258760 [Crassisporium funariophilum]|nr:hypothetical protein B0H34DRAFT_258760 [Crassisporium funariophilum]
MNLTGSGATVEVRFAVDQVKGWGNWAVLWSMQGIMIYRVSSMYYHSRKMICLLVSCFVVEIAITSTMQSLPYDVVFGSGHLTSCVEKVFPRWYRVFWTPIILFESLIFGVSIFKGIRFYKSASTINGIIHTSLGRKSLMYTLLRDSILFPFIALILCFLNVIGWGYFSFTTIMAIVAISGFMARLLGCRLILNLREAYYRPFEEELGQERPGCKDTLHHGDCEVGEEMVRISPA